MTYRDLWVLYRYIWLVEVSWSLHVKWLVDMSEISTCRNDLSISLRSLHTHFDLSISLRSLMRNWLVDISNSSHLHLTCRYLWVLYMQKWLVDISSSLHLHLTCRYLWDFSISHFGLLDKSFWSSRMTSLYDLICDL